MVEKSRVLFAEGDIGNHLHLRARRTSGREAQLSPRGTKAKAEEAAKGNLRVADRAGERTRAERTNE